MALALDLAQALNCPEAQRPCGSCPACRRIMDGKHPDVRVLGLGGQDTEAPAQKAIGIEQIKELQQSAGLHPFEGAFKVFIIDGAEHLTGEAANRLLKTLEEPPPAVCIMLLATDADRLLPTVRSRCLSYELHPLTPEAITELLVSRYQVEPGRAHLLARLAEGSPGWAIAGAQDGQVLEARARQLDQVAELPAQSNYHRLALAGRLAGEFARRREEVYAWLALLQQWWRDLLVVKGGCPELIVNVDRMEELGEAAAAFSLSQIAGVVRRVQETAEQLDRNANPRLALDVLMLNLPALLEEKVA